MITDKFKLRTRYGEVDQMGYVYHANYVCYCHQARTELLRKAGIEDSYLEEKNIMLPVIEFTIQYKKPAKYDEELTIITKIAEKPKVRFSFDFEIFNSKNELISKAASTVVFVNSTNRKPVQIPKQVEEAFEKHFNIYKTAGAYF